MSLNYSAYQQIDVHTADPMKIVLMLYDGAVQFLKKSNECLRSRDAKNKNINLNRAIDIILELKNSLNMSDGGEVAKNLRGLYFFMHRHLVQANLKNDAKGVEEVIQLLSILREAWREVHSQKTPDLSVAKNQLESRSSRQYGLRI